MKWLWFFISGMDTLNAVNQWDKSVVYTTLFILLACMFWRMAWVEVEESRTTIK